MSFKSSFSIWIVLSVIPLGYLSTSAGCKKPPKQQLSPVGPSAAAENSESQLKQQLFEQRVAIEKLSAAYRDLQAKRQSEIKSSTGLSDETATAAAKATVELRDKMGEMKQTLDKLTARIEEIAKSQGQQAAAATPGMTAADLQKLGEEFKHSHDDPNKSATAVPDPAKPAESGTSPGSTSSDEVNKAIKDLAKAAAGIICAVQPEICPYLASFIGVLDLFSSVKDQSTFLNAVSNLATNIPLTDDQRKVIDQVTTDNAMKLPGEALMVLDKVSGSDTAVHEKVNKIIDNLINDNPLANQIVDQIREKTPEQAVEQTKLMLGGRFPSKSMKAAVLTLAKRKGISLQIVMALEGIP